VGYALKTNAGLALTVQAIWDQERDEATGLFTVKVSHPSIAGWDVPSYIELESCFLSMGEGAIGVDVEVAFDPVGTATAVKMTTVDGTMTPTMEKCARDAFMTSKASCPAVPTSIGYARLNAAATKR
jgi:hypothetical protein